MAVRPKKHLGQHFLTDLAIAQKIVSSLRISPSDNLLEVGAGTGVLSQYLFPDYPNYQIVEIDDESVKFLHKNYSQYADNVLHEDFLRYDISDKEQTIIGNFPYNISSQIFFKIWDNQVAVPQVVAMVQKEVAERIASPEGSRQYGILSVLLQAFYEVEYLFTVPPEAFQPPPKVQSAVIRLTRLSTPRINCNAEKLKQVVKQAFGQRRKMLRSSLKSLLKSDNTTNEEMQKILTMRPEHLSVEKFSQLVDWLDNKKC